MSDLISRQAAIDALGTPHGILYPIRTIEELPSVQPLVIHCTDCEDWLERQSTLGFTISGLPSIQPQPVVRCKDCKYADDDGVCQNSVGLAIQDDDDFCSRAERRTDE